MTLDQGAHWGTAINVLKAWSVLIEIESLRNRSNDDTMVEAATKIA